MTIGDGDILLHKAGVEQEQHRHPEHLRLTLRPDRDQHPTQGEATQPAGEDAEDLPGEQRFTHQAGGQYKQPTLNRAIGGESERENPRTEEMQKPQRRPVVPIQTQAENQRAKAEGAQDEQPGRDKPAVGKRRSGKQAPGCHGFRIAWHCKVSKTLS